MTYYEKVSINQKTAERIKYLLHHVPKNWEEAIGDADCITTTVRFSNGVEMDIRLCGSDYDPDETFGNLPWTEAALYDKRGGLISCDGAGDEYFCRWELGDDDGNFYLVDVV